MATAGLGAVGVVVGATRPFVGGTVGADDPIAFEGVEKLVD